MPKIAQELGAAQVAKLKEPGLHAVGGVAGLSLQISPTGARSWILRATIGGKRRDIGLGSFPTVSLADARLRAREARQAIWSGSDPIETRRATRAALIASQARAITFEQAARRAHKARSAGFRNAKHRADWLSSLERYAFPTIGQMRVDAVEVAHVQQVLEPIWQDKTETATRLRQRVESVLSWATVSGFRSGDNPARWKDNLKELMAAPEKIRKRTNYAALAWQDVPAFMADLRRREGVSARCLEFIILTAARSGEARLAVWPEIDLAAKLWTIPAERMKAHKTHRVPLTDDAVRLLQGLPRMQGCEFVFASPRGGSLSDMSISSVCKRMGVAAVPHGFRSSFKDWCRNNTRFPDEVSELALAHVNSDQTRAAYARDELLQPRRELMRQWEKFCFGARLR